MTHKVRTQDLKALAQRVKGITDDLASRIGDLESLAEALLKLTSSIIDNIQGGQNEHDNEMV